MRISHYLRIDKRLKSFRIDADMSQKEMAAKLNLSVPTYSNYENGYSEPPIEIIQKFCSILDIDENTFFGFTVMPMEDTNINTFADVIKVLIALKDAGIPIECSISPNSKTKRLVTSINIESPQIAALISNWTELNNDLKINKIDTDEYNIWIDSLMESFKIPIENY